MSKRKARILVVDDEKEITRALQRGLSTYGYEVLVTHSGEEALELIERQRPDLLLLDLGLPGISGLEVCKQVRAQSHLPPIIVISVRSRESEKVRALDLGADDYVSKPFGMKEVLARIRVALRHASHMPAQIASTVTIGPLQVDFEQRAVSVNEQEVRLTPTEYDLLKLFIEHRGKIVTQQMLLTRVKGSDHNKQPHYLHVYIGNLRRKIEPDPAHPRFLQTISGVGYRFHDEDE
jgi:two-component system, OmpR family, KDP operon response regulator KdpE